MREGIPYALKDGKPVSIDEVDNGLACGCICPSCEEKLVAKNGGTIMAHHFAHYNTGECAGALESAVHLIAKEILLSGNRIKLSPIEKIRVTEKDDKLIDTLVESCYFYYTEVSLEKRLGSVIPDVILTNKEGLDLIIEIKVTHGVDDRKKEKLNEINIGVVEIDLGWLHKKYNEFDVDSIRNEIKNILFGEDIADRKWCYTPVNVNKIFTYLIKKGTKVAKKCSIDDIYPVNTCILAKEKGRVNKCSNCKNLLTIENDRPICVANIDKKMLSNYLKFVEIKDFSKDLPFTLLDIDCVEEFQIDKWQIKIPKIYTWSSDKMKEGYQRIKEFLEDFILLKNELDLDVIQDLQVCLVNHQEAEFWCEYTDRYLWEILKKQGYLFNGITENKYETYLMEEREEEERNKKVLQEYYRQETEKLRANQEKQRDAYIKWIEKERQREEESLKEQRQREEARLKEHQRVCRLQELRIEYQRNLEMKELAIDLGIDNNITYTKNQRDKIIEALNKIPIWQRGLNQKISYNFDLDTRLKFGKYKDKLVGVVLRIDRQYIEWYLEKYTNTKPTYRVLAILYGISLNLFIQDYQEKNSQIK